MLNIEQLYRENRNLAKKAQSRQKTFAQKGYYNQAYENLQNAFDMLDLGSNPFSVKKGFSASQLERQNKMLKKFLSKPTFAETKKEILNKVDKSKYSKSEQDSIIAEYFDVKEAMNYSNMLADSYGSKFIGELFKTNRQQGGKDKDKLYKAIRNTYKEVEKVKKTTGRKVAKSRMLKKLADKIDDDLYNNALE